MTFSLGQLAFRATMDLPPGLLPVIQLICPGPPELPSNSERPLEMQPAPTTQETKDCQQGDSAPTKTLVSIKQSLDTSPPMGRAIVTILMVIYQLESDQTSERMAANVKYKREVLGRHWGPTPFGCDRNA